MKKYILFIFSFLVLNTSMVMAMAPSSGLTGFWKLDEGTGTITANSVTSGSTGTLINGPSWVSGKFGQAVSFDGVDDQIKVSDPTLSNMTTMTLSAWVNPRSGGGNGTGTGRIIAKNDVQNGARFLLTMSSDSSSLQFNAGYTTTGSWKTPAGSLSLNSWHNVVVTYTHGDASNVPSLYIDGVLQALTVLQAPLGIPKSDDSSLYIGSRGINNDRVFDGLIDQVRIYNRVLSASEVSSLYTSDYPPNIVVIMTDDQDDTGSLDFMPQLQQLLINQGTRFTNSFVDFSLCCPSRATFLTGQAAHNHGNVDIAPPGGGYGLFIPQEGNTLPVWLQNAGYNTAVIGKYLNGYGTLSSETHIPPGWNTYDLFEQSPALLYFGYRMNQNGVIKTYGSADADYQTDVLAQKAADYIDSRQSSSQPFFLWLTPHAPHIDGGQSDTGPTVPNSPQPAPRHRGLFANQPLPMLANFNEADVSDKPGHVAARPLLDASAIATTTANYRGRLVANLSLDDMVARVVAKLQETGKLDNTIIVYTSDNGWANGQHRLLYGKHEVYDEIIRVPLVMRGPGIPQGEIRTPMVNNLDLVATIVDLTKITPGHAPDGSSLLPLLNYPNTPWRSTFLVQGKDLPSDSAKTNGGTFMAVRTNNYLYAEHNSNTFGLEKELYDLATDPYQLNNKSSDPVYASIMSDLQNRLATLRTCAGSSCWMTVAEPPLPIPTVTITASSTTITSGQSSTLTWSSTNANSCTASGAWSGTKATSGSQPVSPTITSTYTITCSGIGGSATQSATITVTAPPTFSIGSRVKTITSLYVRNKPTTNSKILCTKPADTFGTITSGPTFSGGYTWWKINYDTGCDGWSVQNYLTVVNVSGASSSTRVPISSTLSIGSTGQEVSTLQSFLTKLGFYSDQITGYFGALTQRAVMNFQTANALDAVGVVGPKTRAALLQMGW